MSRPKRPDHAVTLDLKVAFYQCDPLAVAWHGRYFEWFEQARSALFASIGLEVGQIRDLGHRMYVVDARCRYMAPLAYADPVRVTAWFIAASPLIRVGYDIYNPDTERWCARAFTVLATTDAGGALLPKTPDAIVRRLPVA
ncbi:MAG: acyl-CoA thioesterase [Planctomycetes bacterium]|nr:acyl-CoA thioesterase [Planctomycetota bacterium]